MQTLEYLKNKYNLDLTQPSPIEIANVGRLDLLRWFRELGFKRGAEIGVDHGEFSKLMCEHAKVKVYGIDPYLKYDDYHEYDSQEQMDNIFKDAQRRLKNEIINDQYEFIRKPSMEALADFEDESLDFVYIDGNHEADFPYQDIKHWAKKVRKGGMICGHDYVRIKILDFTIKDALERYTKEENINTWFVLGSYQVRPREIRDGSRSWMIIKS